MPYSFTQIEKEKSGIIFWVFLFLVVFYFATAWVLYWVVKNYLLLESSSPGLVRLWELPSGIENLRIFIVAAVVGFLHAWFSTADMLPRLLTLLQAKTLDEKDPHHQMLQNVVDEVSVATGGKKILARVVPCSAMNAFAIMDFDGSAVIGVTEGLLSRLTRAQVEAVVGHEAAHIASGDCLSTTVISALFGVYDAVLRGIEGSFDLDDRCVSYPTSRRGGGGVLLLMVYGLLLITQFMSMILRMFISRQRELRADAVAVRLTRDPLSLAQALYAISFHWRGGGLSVDELSAIFIVNPNSDLLDEEEGFWSDLFSTHPPVRKRLKILLGMARASLQELEDNFMSSQPQASMEGPQTMPVSTAPASRWMAFGPDGQWQGFFNAPQLSTTSWFTPETWVKREGGDVAPAFMDAELNQHLRGEKKSSPEAQECPRCQLPLVEMLYEGVPILDCGYCRGVLVKKNDDLQTIIIRRDMKISPRVQKLGDMIEREQRFNPRVQASMKGMTLFDCPVCLPQKNQMIRKFFNLAYPVEIDQCLTCEATWFDSDELEILQYLIEKNTQKFYA